ncbi:MAG: NAD-dependent dehydratase [Bdellovibrionales bacterium RIFOXYB1_FULL_37_110]|nr:MAG: NAD-dependent dehydratase [Bdellovibrionales bacterium RIFOXYC1_FULL_37_79]OFZ58834.1 MAG: NAD-dependent dehydratase [Bdellovibrionales bacterium RIFOXYB1_FULL_37_110]OFZ64833.1 MAG: NAD-dependent dehydratase [Bdellovibrionales bacterium RIFOXYD1_FULL_36_51]
MKRCLVTGADGFIGSHLTELLVSSGYKVKALSQYNSFNYWGWLEDIDCKNQVEIVSGDIRDSKFCDELVKEVDCIFHLAALIAIPYSYVAPESYISTNVNGTLNICHSALKNGNIRVIHTSTSEVYGTAQFVPITEKHPLQPQSPYSASKIGADAIAMSYFNAFNLPVTIARPFNTFGPRQSARAIIPTIITQIASGVKKIKLGDLTPTRDFNYVKDTCRGFLELAKADNTKGKTVNICSNYEVSMKDTLELIKKLMNSDVEFITDEARIRPATSEVFRLWGDNTLIKELTGFNHGYKLDNGMMETINWYSNPENLKKFKSNIYNV